jgi:hypothetical protein
MCSFQSSDRYMSLAVGEVLSFIQGCRGRGIR